MPRKPTTAELRCLDALRRLTERDGYAPTCRELGKELGVWHTAVSQWLAKLRAKGLVTFRDRAFRTVRIVEAKGA